MRVNTGGWSPNLQNMPRPPAFLAGQRVAFVRGAHEGTRGTVCNAPLQNQPYYKIWVDWDHPSHFPYDSAKQHFLSVDLRALTVLELLAEEASG
jgi:hypothetical protein